MSSVSSIAPGGRLISYEKLIQMQLSTEPRQSSGVYLVPPLIYPASNGNYKAYATPHGVNMYQQNELWCGVLGDNPAQWSYEPGCLWETIGVADTPIGFDMSYMQGTLQDAYLTSYPYSYESPHLVDSENFGGKDNGAQSNQETASRQSIKRSCHETAHKRSQKGPFHHNYEFIIAQASFHCNEEKCKAQFRRREHLKRHSKTHSKERLHVCWVPGCHRAFSRNDNLKGHMKTHCTKKGKNRYVASLDKTSEHFDPNFHGTLSSDGLPVYSR